MRPTDPAPHTDSLEPEITHHGAALAIVRPKLRMRSCFHCRQRTGIRSDDDHDEFDTCGNPVCRREARAEALQQIAEEQDWQCD